VCLLRVLLGEQCADRVETDRLVGVLEEAQALGDDSLVLPLLQEHDFLSLEPHALDVNVSPALTSEREVRADVDTSWSVAIATDHAALETAATRLLGLDVALRELTHFPFVEAEAPDRAGPKEVAEATLRCLKAHVPEDVPGIAFLSGGQTAEEATEHLSIMNATGKLPWELSFSYGRALQAPTLSAWRGKEENFGAGQDAFIKRAKLNSLAHQGRYDAAMEEAA